MVTVFSVTVNDEQIMSYLNTDISMGVRLMIFYHSEYTEHHIYPTSLYIYQLHTIIVMHSSLMAITLYDSLDDP